MGTPKESSVVKTEVVDVEVVLKGVPEKGALSGAEVTRVLEALSADVRDSVHTSLVWVMRDNLGTEGVTRRDLEDAMRQYSPKTQAARTTFSGSATGLDIAA